MDRDKHWDAPSGFFDALARLGAREGLTSGATFTEPDIDHLQAVAPHDEAKMWAMTATQRNDYIA